MRIPLFASQKMTYDWLAEEGWVSARRHPELPITLYCYSQKCLFDGGWNLHTLAARGLVLDDNGRTVARPWEKFFNLGQTAETQLEALPNEVPEIAEKLDGSLIIAFHYAGRWLCCTKGAWDSTQARWAQRWLDERQPWALSYLDPGTTYLFELLAPWNRIVVPYAKEELALLGLVHTESGDDDTYERVAAHAAAIGLRAPKVLRGRPGDFDMTGGTPEEEGFVVRYSTGLRVKMKYECYLALHKIVTGLSVRGIWERLQTGDLSMPESLPDEFMGWFQREKTAILDRRQALLEEVANAWSRTSLNRPRKEIALEWVQREPLLKACLFRRLDGKQYEDLLWKACRPERTNVFKQEDA